MGRFIPLAVVMTAAALLGLYTQAGFELVHRHDKVAHVVGGVVLALSVAHAFPQWPLVRVALLCTAAAFALEGVQWLLPGRTATWGDMAAGVGGIAVGLCVLRARAEHRALRGN